MKFLTFFCWFVAFVISGLLLWASSHAAIWAIPQTVSSHPWFVTTVVDAYFALAFIALWAGWRESQMLFKILWPTAIMALGNPAVAAYVLIRIAQLGRAATAEKLLTREEPS
jgi:hypothetical protein